MKNVYIIMKEDVYDYDTDSQLWVFEDSKKAYDYFNNLVTELKKEYSNVFDTIESDGDYIQCYNNGYYLERHIEITISKYDVL